MGLIYKNGGLVFGETHFCDLREAFASVPTPFYLYDLDAIKAKAAALQAAIPGAQLHYAVKANATKKVLSALQQMRLGADVVSGGEVRRALEAGFSPKDVIFSGVGKTKDEIGYALDLGLKQINVESPQELERIIVIAKAKGKCPNVAFRMNPDVDAKTHPYITTGFRENKFGMDESFLPQLKSILRANPGAVNLCGLTIHIGSQLRDLAPMRDAIRKTKPIYSMLLSEGFAMKTFDIGGGLGIPYDEPHTVPSRDFDLIQRYGEMVRAEFHDFPATILCEPGRILVGSAGVLVAEVQYVKEAPQKKFLILNTGMHHLMRPALYQAFHNILPLSENKDRPKKMYDVVGPICESSDAMGKNRELHEVHQEERVAIADAGAYGITMASNYNEHALPKQFYWENNALSEG